jgi:TM2 domain-containing membrane protein YozV
VSHHVHHVPEPPPEILEDRVAGWLADRIYNDREADAGLLMVVLGLWIFLFHGTMDTTMWWHEVFTVLPEQAWALLLGTLGAARLILSRFGRGRLLASAAAASCFTLAFLSLITGLVRHQMMVTPLFVWLAYQALKSHLRLMLNRRRAGS